MNTPVMGLRVAAIIFGLACLGQLSRLLLHVSVMFGSHHVPMWWSAIAAIVLAGLCSWLWRLSLPPKPASTPRPASPPSSAVPTS